MAKPTLDEWLEMWEAEVEDGQSNISRSEAVRRYFQWHGDEEE